MKRLSQTTLRIVRAKPQVGLIQITVWEYRLSLFKTCNCLNRAEFLPDIFHNVSSGLIM